MSSKIYDGEHIDLNELDSKLFDCADTLRGNVDKGRYKDFVLPLVFYAAVNGRFDAEMKQMAEEHMDEKYEDLNEEDEKFLEQQVEKDIGIKIPEDNKWDDLMDEHKNIASKIDSYFQKFENDNDGKYNNIFNNKFSSIESFKSEEGSNLLKKLLRKIDTINFESIPPDVMGEAYMNLVKRFSEQDSGEYFTPPRIVDLMVRILQPFEKGSTYHDPTAGSAGMLVEASEHIREQYEDEFENDEELQEFIEREFLFTGQELNPTITGIAKMNMALHGLDGSIRRGNSLTNPQFTKESDELEKFDYILANFPFSQRGWKDETAERQKKFGDMNWAENGKLPNGNYGDFAFIMHMDSILEEHGQMASVIPHGVLFRNTDQRYREYMIDEDIVEAVIGLPENLFEDTGIPSAILVINKDKPEDREGEVMFINANHEDRLFEDTSDDRSKLLNDGISEVKSKYEEWSQEERVCRVVDTEEIEENDYNMNIALYVDTTEPQEDISVENTLEDIRTLEAEYSELQQQFNTYMQQLEYKQEESTGNRGDEK